MKIATIIPAYNEERTIGNLLDTIKQVDIIDEIIVVDDGSTDNTCKISFEKDIKTIKLPVNQGKAAAILIGMNHTDADAIVLLDADLIGLTASHIINLITPIIDQEVLMTCGLFCSGRIKTDFGQKLTPFLSGQRAIKREVLEEISYLEEVRFGLEIALTMYIKRNNIPFKTIPMENLTHLTKEEKLGFIKGVSARLKMYWEVIKTLKIS